MGRKELFTINKNKIINYIKIYPFYYSKNDLQEVLYLLKEKKLVSESLYFDKFFNKLIDNNLQTYTLKIKDKYYTRYSLIDSFDEYKFAATISKKSFFSMTTSLNIQKLSDYRDDFIFISKELNKRNLISTGLEQKNINNSFKNKNYRYTNNIGQLNNKNYILLSPKYSNNYEIIEFNGFKVSSINRVLVEMIINIQYFQSSENIIQIFRPIKDKLDLLKIFTLLNKLNYIYPYYQSLGFFLEKIGFSKKELKIFKNETSKFDFYTEKLKESYLYDDYWKIYY